MGKAVVCPRLLLTVLASLWLGGCHAAEAPKRKVDMMCGGYTWVITCGRDNTSKTEDPRECNKNSLTVRSPDGKVTVIKDPPLTTEFHDDRRPVMLEGTTPTGMLCLPKQGRYYVSVDYSRGSGAQGEFIELFSEKGSRYTSIGIPLQRSFKDPYDGIGWRNLPKEIRIEGE